MDVVSAAELGFLSASGICGSEWRGARAGALGAGLRGLASFSGR